jgi:hypothetical protein
MNTLNDVISHGLFAWGYSFHGSLVLTGMDPTWFTF